MTKDEIEFIDGATLISDCNGLKIPWATTKNDQNRLEAENISRAQKKYLNKPVNDPSFWFHVKELKSIHQAMFGDVYDWAGHYRKSVTSIGIQPTMIPLRLAELCAEVSSWSIEPVELTFVERAARIHHELVSIHPFENGNGRFSRFVADRYLLAWRCPHPFWPEDLQQNGPSRQKYILTLKEADRMKYYEPLIEFMLENGAKDPTLSELLGNNFYLKFLKQKAGVALIKAILRRMNNPNDKTANGHHVLQLATKASLNEVVQVLVEAGAQIDQVDQSGLTPFQVAVMRESKSLADFLKSKGAKDQSPPGLGYIKYYKLYQKL